MNTYRISKFTYVLEKESCFMLYNSYSKKICTISEKQKFLDILSKKVGNTNSKLFDDLIYDGFFVQESLDEDSLALLSHFDHVAHNELFLTILPTLKCNFRCEYCYQDFKDSRLNDEMCLNIVNFVKTHIVNNNRLLVDWFGGEPLLEIDTINKLSQKLIGICKNRKKPYSATITTNGYFLTEDVFKNMLKNKVFNFQITVDGLQKSHDTHRHLANGNGSFEVIINNLLNIKKIPNAWFTIVVRTNVTKEIYDDFDDYLEMLYNNFGDDRRFTFLFRPAGDWGGERVSKIRESLLTSFDDVYLKLTNTKYRLNFSMYIGLLTGGGCLAANRRNSFTIKPDGKILKCSMLLDNPLNEVGFFNEQGKSVMDYGKLGKWIYRFSDKLDKCFSCKLLPSCNNSQCPAKGIILESKGACGYENTDIDKVLTLLEKDKERYTFISKY